MSADFDLESFLDRSKETVESYADGVLPSDHKLPGVLGASMRYSFFAGGKRFRPALAFAAAEAVCGRVEPALPFATAIEMIHTYSLIHDDLPAMDDDELRRGMPTNHVKYGEAIAILAGDALLSDAFTLLTDPKIVSVYDGLTITRCINEIAKAAGSTGMVAGQAMDVLSEGCQLDLPTLEFLHICKTGALIRASVLTGAYSAGIANEEQLTALKSYASRLGLAFQIADDILDVEGDTETLGKPVGSDEERNAATYPSRLGMQESKELLAELIDQAVEQLAIFGEKGEALKALAFYVAGRDR